MNSAPSKTTVRKFLVLLKDLQNEHGLSDTQLARVVGKPRSTVQSWRKGTRSVSLDAVETVTARVIVANEVLGAVRKA